MIRLNICLNIIVLSKLKYFSAAHPDVLINEKSGLDISPILDEMGLTGAVVNCLDIGTLSIACIVAKGNSRIFIKTSLGSEGQENLNKEIAILKHLYQEVLFIESLSVKNQVWLAMSELVPTHRAHKPNEILNLISDLTNRFKDFENVSLIQPQYSLENIIAEAWMALEHLSQRNLLCEKLSSAVEFHLKQIDQELGGYGETICHGDLGPLNLMNDGRRKFVIDWEDAFWGVEGYDYVYWLSFFSNRKYYNPSYFGKTRLGGRLEKSFLALIVLLKCELSLRNCTYVTNKLSINQRLGEVLAIP